VRRVAISPNAKLNVIRPSIKLHVRRVAMSPHTDMDVIPTYKSIKLHTMRKVALSCEKPKRIFFPLDCSKSGKLEKMITFTSLGPQMLYY
jgi:hypothetical protein